MNVTRATQLAVSLNCVKTNLTSFQQLRLSSALTYLFVDSLTLGSQGVLHFTRTDDHFTKKVCYCMDAALSFSWCSPQAS